MPRSHSPSYSSDRSRRLWDEAKAREEEDDAAQVKDDWTSELRVIKLLMDVMHRATTRTGQLKAIGVLLTYLANIPRFLATQVKFRTTLCEELDVWQTWGLNSRDVSRAKDLLAQVKRRPDYVFAAGEAPEEAEKWDSECRVLNTFMDKIDAALSADEKRRCACAMLTYLECIPAFLRANREFCRTLIQTMALWRSDGLDQQSVDRMTAFLDHQCQ